MIGSIGLSCVVWDDFLSAFLGYKLDFSYQGMGYMTEEVERIVEYAFSLGLHRV